MLEWMLPKNKHIMTENSYIVLILDLPDIWLLAASCENWCTTEIHIFSKNVGVTPKF